MVIKLDSKCSSESYILDKSCATDIGLLLVEFNKLCTPDDSSRMCFETVNKTRTEDPF